MPSPAEIAYREAIRGLEGQARDLEGVRSHISIVLSAGGIAAAFLGGQSGHHGLAFWVAVLAFGTMAAVTIRAFWPVTFAWDFDGYAVVNTYVDVQSRPSDEFVMRELAVHAADDYQDNRTRLDRLMTLQSLALVAFGAEVGALLVNLAVK